MVTLKIKDIYVYMYGCFYFSERTTTVGILTGKPCEESTSSATALEAAVISTSVLSGVLFCTVCCVFLFFGYVKRKENCFIKRNILWFH